MIVSGAGRGGRPGAVLRSTVTALPRCISWIRRNPPPEQLALAGLVLLTLVLVLGGLLLGPTIVPPVSYVIPVIGGGLLLGRRSMRLLLVVVLVALVLDVAMIGLMEARPGALVVLLVAALVSYEFARAREETGLAGARGESVLVELRDRLERQGQLPRLPREWAAEAVLRPAGGGPFAGDFVVSATTRGGQALEVALVDVSGKGVDAGTRALMLSGAMGGLLGAVPAAEFLAGANAYLVRQDWDEGFATAVHVEVDLTTGAYAVVSAGHPPAALFDAGSGRWSLLGSQGVGLGLLPDSHYRPDHGRLETGDALLLYTDGLVEVPGQDLSVGIDKLLGEAERLVPHGFAGGGALLVDRVAATSTDDRGLVLLWRAG